MGNRKPKKAKGFLGWSTKGETSSNRSWTKRGNPRKRSKSDCPDCLYKLFSVLPDAFFLIHFMRGSKEGEKGWQGEDFYLLIYSPNAHNHQIWARQKPGAWTSTQVSYVSDRDSRTWAIACCLPGCAQEESGWGAKEQRLEPDMLMWNAGIPRDNLTSISNTHLSTWSLILACTEQSQYSPVKNKSCTVIWDATFAVWTLWNSAKRKR